MEVLKSIDVLTEDSGITDDDFLVWFDENLKTHKKIKKSDFGGSKWTDGTTPTRIYRDGNIIVGSSSAISDLAGLGVIGRATGFNDSLFIVRNQANTVDLLRVNGQGALIANTNTVKFGAGLPTGIPTNTFRYVTTIGLGVSQTVFEIINDSSQVLLQVNSNGRIRASHLPTSDPLVAGMIWRDGNDLKISTG
jgi:hypothetical protein